MMTDARSSIVLNFQDRAEVLRTRKALEAIEQFRSVLGGLRDDMQFISLIEELSATSPPGPIDVSSQHVAALAGIQETLERIAALLPHAGAQRTGRKPA